MSNILANTFKLMDEIKDYPVRSEIYQSFTELHRDSITQGSIGYHGRQAYKQFLGYLAIYDDRDRINQESPIKMPELSQLVVDRLAFGHNYIRSLNTRFLDSFLDLIPAATNVVSPYWMLESRRNIPVINMPDSEAQKSLVQSFQLSKPFKVIRNRLKYLPALKDMKEQDIANAIYSILERIKHFGLKNCPEDIFELSIKINQTSADSMLGAIIFSIIAIHSMLQVLDQLLFQAFTAEKFQVLDENTIFSVPHMGENGLSDILEVKSDIGIYFPGEIIIVNLPFDQLPEKKRFCLVERVEMSFTQDFGNESSVGVRCIDTSGCAYSNLIRNIMEI